MRLTILKLLKSVPDLPTPLTTEVLKKGHAEAPHTLQHLFMVLCTGLEKVGEHDSYTERYVRAASDDAVFATTKGV